MDVSGSRLVRSQSEWTVSTPALTLASYEDFTARKLAAFEQMITHCDSLLIPAHSDVQDRERLKVASLRAFIVRQRDQLTARGHPNGSEQLQQSRPRDVETISSDLTASAGDPALCTIAAVASPPSTSALICIEVRPAVSAELKLDLDWTRSMVCSAVEEFCLEHMDFSPSFFPAFDNESSSCLRRIKTPSEAVTTLQTLVLNAIHKQQSDRPVAPASTSIPLRDYRYSMLPICNPLLDQRPRPEASSSSDEPPLVWSPFISSASVSGMIASSSATVLRLSPRSGLRSLRRISSKAGLFGSPVASTKSGRVGSRAASVIVTSAADVHGSELNVTDHHTAAGDLALPGNRSIEDFTIPMDLLANEDSSSVNLRLPPFTPKKKNKTITDEEVVTLERIKREKEIKVGLQATKRKYKKIDNALLANGTAAEKTVSPNQLKALKRGKQWMKKRRAEIKRNNKHFEMTCDMMLGIRTMVAHTAASFSTVRLPDGVSDHLQHGSVGTRNEDVENFNIAARRATAPVVSAHSEGRQPESGPGPADMKRRGSFTIPLATSYYAASRELTEEDFVGSFKLDFPSEGSPITPPHPHRAFEFKDYGGAVFAKLRQFFGIRDDDYISSIASGLPYLDFISNSKSGMFFFYTHDKKYMIKSQPKEESRFFRKILKQYYLHVTANPTTLLSRVFGIHRIGVEGRFVHFMIMSNVFYAAKTIHTRFDLKGSTIGRAATDREKQQLCPVLKDLDFVDTELQLGPKKDPLMRQIARDCKFLEDLEIMDYSLLVGIHYRKKKHRPKHDVEGQHRPKFDSEYETENEAQLTARTVGSLPEAPSRELAVLPGVAVSGTPMRVVRTYSDNSHESDVDNDAAHHEQPPKSGLREFKQSSDVDEVESEEEDEESNSQNESGMPISSYYGLTEHQHPALNTKLRNPKVMSFLRRLSISGPKVMMQVAGKRRMSAHLDHEEDAEDKPQPSAAEPRRRFHIELPRLALDQPHDAGSPHHDSSFTANLSQVSTPAHAQHISKTLPNVPAPSEATNTQVAEDVEQHSPSLSYTAPSPYLLPRAPPTDLHDRRSMRSKGDFFRAEDGGLYSVNADGQVGDEIYYLGIIDILQIYNRRKQAEHLLKSMFSDGKSISAVDPHFYSVRFQKFLGEHVK